MTNKEVVLNTNRLRSIQYLRGIAALIVVLTHSGVYLMQSYEYPSVREFFGDYWSYFGVIAFFCMSGFLLTSLVKTPLPVFFTHRVIRIFPSYLIALVATLLVFRLIDYPLPPLDWRILLLIPIGAEPYRPLHVEWTLVFEVAYYLILALFCVSIFRKYLVSFYIIWLGFLAYLFLTGGTPGTILPSGFEIYLSSWNMAFIAGGLSWVLYDRNWMDWRLGFLGFVLILLCTIHVMATAFLAPAGVALVIAYFAKVEQEGKMGFHSNILETLGSWSYAMYLIHVPIMRIFLPFFAQRDLSPLSAWFSVLGIVLLASAILGEIDIYIYRFLKSRVDRFFTKSVVQSPVKTG